MHGIRKLLVGVSFLTIVSASVVSGAVIKGAVKGADGAPFMGAFVMARNSTTKITVSVLSDRSGRYHIDALPAGQYDVRIRAVGYQGDPRLNVNLAASQDEVFDFALQPGIVKWSDMSYSQAAKLWPDEPGKAKLMSRCFVCHEFQNKMASRPRDEDGWRQAVNYMRDTMGVRGPRFTDQDSENVIKYLTSLFSDNSVLPKNPADMPGYKETVHHYADDAMKIVYVEFETGRDKMPFSATPDKNGIAWIPMAGDVNKLGRLDPSTGQITEFKVPYQKAAQVHSAYPAPDGTVWIAEDQARALGKWDPKTQEITEYPDGDFPKHTVRIDQHGTPWISPGTSQKTISRFDIETGKFTHFPGSEEAYGIVLDKDGNCWFVQYVKDGQIGKIDASTGKVTKWTVPTPDARPRRIDIDSEGNIWFAEFQGGKIGRFDPKTEKFKEWTLPGSKPGPYPDDENGPYPIGSDPGPYGFVLDKNQNGWYAGVSTDTIGEVNPKTGKVTEYPFTHSELTVRELFVDAQGHIWFGSAGNDRVGYFYLAK
jgi:virginiamycin B lyase